MTQADRDRLVTLRKAQKRLITQQHAAEELRITVRQVRRLLRKLEAQGDQAVIHGLRGRPSNRRLSEATRRRVVEILKETVYRGFGPTMASEHLRRRYQIRIGREALRQLMSAAGLWRSKRRKVEEIHTWRPRRSRFGELVQWDTSDHDWLEGRGERLYLIHMIDDATSRLQARFVRHDTTAENLRMLGGWLERHGRMLACYTDQASMFQTAPKSYRKHTELARDEREPLPPTQIGRALNELGIVWIGAHSPQAKGRVERSFQTAQDRLVKELRVAGAGTCEQANRVLEEIFLPWWEANCTVQPAHPDDAHRRLDSGHNLDAILSIVDSRQVGGGDYTFRVDNQLYQIERADIVAGMRGARLRIERRLDGSMAVAFRGKYLRYRKCETATAARPTGKVAVPGKPAVKKTQARQPRSSWMAGFDLRKSPPVWKAARASEKSGRSTEVL